jgi:DNA-binding MarR family transcriptional regulator
LNNLNRLSYEMEPAKKPLSERFIQVVEELYLCMRAQPPDEWSNLELTMSQIRTLLFLRRTPQRMTDIASYLGITVSSATSMVDRLVSKGVVERAHDTADRRVVICRLTALGDNEVERFWRIGRKRIESLADALSVDELQAVVNAFEILSVAVKRDPALEG